MLYDIGWQLSCSLYVNTPCCYYNSGLFDLHIYKYFQYKFYYEKIVSNVHQCSSISTHWHKITTYIRQDENPCYKIWRVKLFNGMGSFLDNRVANNYTDLTHQLIHIRFHYNTTVNMCIVMVVHTIINQLLSIQIILNDPRIFKQLHWWCL